MKQMYYSNDTCVLLINSHVVWCPKRRRKMGGGRRTTRLEELIRETAPELECEMVALEIMPDHLHLLVSATPQWATQPHRWAVQGQNQPHPATGISFPATHAVLVDSFVCLVNG
ncbi:MAG: hypothetical protein KatS3mg055_3423 [Chloroflexus sp.]|nr:MAG: hypothetical protein KatS3mg055_3423 [Chloroflexus sp.]